MNEIREEDSLFTIRNIDDGGKLYVICRLGGDGGVWVNPDSPIEELRKTIEGLLKQVYRLQNE